MNNNNNNSINKILIINEKKLIGVDKFIIDFSFLKGYIKQSINVIIGKSEQANFIQTKILLCKQWTDKFKVVNEFFYNITLKNDESYFLDNFFLYDNFIFFKMYLKDYDENCDYIYSTILHPFLFALNLAILLYIQDKRKFNYSEYILSKYNFNYKNKDINFLSTNTSLFEKKFNELKDLHNNIIKIDIKNFNNSITADVFRKFVYEKYNIEWEVLETIINYSKNVCSDGSKIIPTLEFSPLYSYLKSYCVLEGVIEEIKKAIKIKINILSYDDDIYLFFDNFDDWSEIKFTIENIFFINKFELNYKNIKTIKINNYLTHNDNNYTKVKFSEFYNELIYYFKVNKNITNSRDIFLNFLNEKNLENPFYTFNIDDVSFDEYKNILTITNSNNNDIYFKILDSNPKHFIRLFYLLDKKFPTHSKQSKKLYLLSNVVSKFQEYKYSSSIINNDYYLYYYLFNSFKGLENNKISKNKFIYNIDPFYVNFQTFIFYIHNKKCYSYLKIKNNYSLKIKHNKFISSLMFFLQNQYLLRNYNDCILIVSTLYDLIKKKITSIVKKVDHVKFIEFMNKKILPKYKIDPINIDDWKKINKFRNGLTSCHIGLSDGVEDFQLNSLEKSLKNIIEWIFKSSNVKLDNNFNKFLFCLEELITNKEYISELFCSFINISK